MSGNLLRLPAFAESGDLNVVVETPRGCSLKLKLDEERGIFLVSRALPTGLTYPYDFGFIPGTEGPDGDPLDVMALHEHASYPGVVLPARLIGLLAIDQKGERGRRQQNDRLLAVPRSNTRLDGLREVADLQRALREEIEHFFLDTSFHTGKDAKAHGWRSSRQAEAAVRKATKAR